MRRVAVVALVAVGLLSVSGTLAAKQQPLQAPVVTQDGQVYGHVLELGGLGIIVTLASPPSSAIQQPAKLPDVTFQLPVVTAAAVPQYPPVALAANVFGLVKIRVTTDGAKVSVLHVDEGPPLLAEATTDNIRTWQFAQHKATTFVAMFEYQIDEPSQCPLVNPTVALDLPIHVRIAAQRIYICDPVNRRSSSPSTHPEPPCC
jgi:hypothetical protein